MAHCLLSLSLLCCEVHVFAESCGQMSLHVDVMELQWPAELHCLLIHEDVNHTVIRQQRSVCLLIYFLNSINFRAVRCCTHRTGSQFIVFCGVIEIWIVHKQKQTLGLVVLFFSSVFLLDHFQWHHVELSARTTWSCVFTAHSYTGLIVWYFAHVYCEHQPTQRCINDRRIKR